MRQVQHPRAYKEKGGMDQSDIWSYTLDRILEGLWQTDSQSENRHFKIGTPIN